MTNQRNSLSAGLPSTRCLRAAVGAALLGASALGAFRLEVFAPFSPMLAQTAAGVAEALRELGAGLGASEASSSR